MRQKCMIACLLILSSVHVYAQKRVITVDDLWAFRRIQDIAISPDGMQIAYSVTEYEPGSNKKNSDIFISSIHGGSSERITTHPAYDGNPCWHRDGDYLAFLSMRTGSSQIHMIRIGGGEAIAVSDIPTGVDDFQWSPDGETFAFTTHVYPELSTLDSTVIVDKAMADDPVKARIYTSLLFRHWNRWCDGKRSHLYAMDAQGDRCWNITPGPYDTPPISLGSHRDFAYSPDGAEIAFVRNADSAAAVSTNNDICVVPARGGTIRRITDNPANDNQPVYSPNGRYIAYRAMKRPGFEADQYDLMLFHRRSGKTQNLTPEFDLDVGEIIWGPTGERIYFTAMDGAKNMIFRWDLKGRGFEKIVESATNTKLTIAPDESQVFFCRSQIHLPHEIYSCNIYSKELFQLTHVNNDRLQQLEMNAMEDLITVSYDGTTLHGMLVKPPFFDPAKKYPGILLIHGGPQGAWMDDFHYRWNAQMFASIGAVVIMLNIRGSKGYGQSFCDEVTRNWGGAPYRDLLAGLEYTLKKYRFIDPQKLAAAGASYGGYMINWIAGHTDRFKALVCHDGIVNPLSFYGTTEELWFPNWEFGSPPYENERSYERWSPLRFARNFRTPMLVVHGGQDFRTSLEQGLQLFTALQQQNVPSKFLYFPDEGHFVQKPLNAKLWWNTVLDFIAEHLDDK